MPSIDRYKSPDQELNVLRQQIEILRKAVIEKDNEKKYLEKICNDYEYLKACSDNKNVDLQEMFLDQKEHIVYFKDLVERYELYIEVLKDKVLRAKFPTFFHRLFLLNAFKENIEVFKKPVNTANSAQDYAGSKAIFTTPTRGSWRRLKEKLSSREKINVVFVNDNGFLYGAGIALKRQVLSFLTAGHNVACVACQYGDSSEIDVSRFPGNFLGFSDMRSRCAGLPKAKVVTEVLDEIYSYEPDLVVSGNFHAAGWPVEILRSMHSSGLPVIAYAHDCDWATGGCAHPSWYDCDKYISGCNDDICIKPLSRYPRHDYGDIQKERRCRDLTFNDVDAVPIATNSIWSTKVFQDAYPSNTRIETVYLSLDTNLFKIQEREIAREALGLPVDRFIVLAGSCSFDEPGKGGTYMINILEHYKDSRSVHIVTFGHPQDKVSAANITNIGFISDEKRMALIYAAADAFVNPVVVESFGQTMLEASACGLPIICFPVCGVPDIARSGENAKHVKFGDVDGLISAIEDLRRDPRLRENMGMVGRNIVENEFSLQSGYYNFEKCIQKLCYDILKKDILTGWTMKESYVEKDRETINLNSLHGGSRCKSIYKKDFLGYPLVTVAIVVLNQNNTLEKTILSVLEQDYPNLELVVVDGCSTDGTLDVIKKYDDYIDFWVSEKDRGIYDAMNKAALYSYGQFLNYMNADDQFTTSDAVSKVFRDAPHDADVIFGHVYYKLANGSETLQRGEDFNSKWEKTLAGDFFSEPWLKGLPPHQATFARTKLVRKHKFDTSIKISADWDLLFRLRKHGARFFNVDHVVAVYRAGGFSAEAPHLWIEDVWGIAKRFSKHPDNVDSYFEPIHQEYIKIKKEAASDLTG